MHQFLLFKIRSYENVSEELVVIMKWNREPKEKQRKHVSISSYGLTHHQQQNFVSIIILYLSGNIIVCFLPTVKEKLIALSYNDKTVGF